MKELFKYLVIRMTTRHAETAVSIYERIYQPQKNNTIINVSNNHFTTETKDDTSKLSTVTTVSKSNTKKDEILDSLNYLKNKKVKTKQDKDSIYSLEMVLKNMK